MRSTHAVLILFAAGFLAGTNPLAAQDAQSRLWDAAIAGDTAAIRKAVADGARIDALDMRKSPNGRYALNWAAYHNKADAVQLLVALKAPLEGENLTGFTALNHAAENGSINAAKVLLGAGADPDHANKAGATPAETAAARGHEALATLIRAAPRKKK